jgi:hypothetical protein
VSRKPTSGRWVAHVEVPLSAGDAERLERTRSGGEQALLRVPPSTKVKVDEVDCSMCRRGIGRCTEGDPDGPCSAHAKMRIHTRG